MQTFASRTFHANACVAVIVRKRLIKKFCLLNSGGLLIFVNQKLLCEDYSNCKLCCLYNKLKKLKCCRYLCKLASFFYK
jgi:hypothetical protein